jgi:hypothetical protein
MNITPYIYRVGVRSKHQGQQNVVAEVFWALLFEDEGFESLASTHTLLEIKDLSSFTPIEQLTKEQIVAWCVEAQGGQPYLDNLTTYHTFQVEFQKRRAGIEEYEGELGFSLDGYPSSPVTEG